MYSQKSEIYFLFTLIGLISVVTFFIFQPFLYALLLAVIFATAFAPVHKRIQLLVPKNRGISASLTTAFVLVVTVVPLTLLGTQIFYEATDLYSSAVSNGGSVAFSRGLEGALREFGISQINNTPINVSQYLEQGLSWLIQNLGSIFSNIARIMVGLFVLLVALYYLFRDGDKFRKAIIALSPLQDIYDEAIIKKLEGAINSVVRGSISVGIIQGCLTAIGLTLFGVPNGVLWGSVAVIAALIPGAGTAIVFVPAILYLFIIGDTPSAFGLIAWGAVAVGMVDNVLGPKLMGRGMQLHPFLTLLSILGGVSFFGPIGLLFGPLVLSLLFAFLEIYSLIRKEKK